MVLKNQDSGSAGKRQHLCDQTSFLNRSVPVDAKSSHQVTCPTRQSRLGKMEGLLYPAGGSCSHCLQTHFTPPSPGDLSWLFYLPELSSTLAALRPSSATILLSPSSLPYRPCSFPIHFPASTKLNFAHLTLSDLDCFSQSHLCPAGVLSFYTRFALIQTSLPHVQLLTAKIGSYSTAFSKQQSGCPPGCLQDRYLREKLRKGRLGTGSGFLSFKKSCREQQLLSLCSGSPQTLLMGRQLGASVENFERTVREIKIKSVTCMVYLFSKMEIKVLIKHFV